MMRIFISLISIFIIMSFGANSAFAQATRWPINKYKIVQQDPTKIRVPYSVEILNGKKKLTSGQMRALEQYFAEVGKEYQRLGFLDPKIDTLTKSGDAFEIFIFDYPDAGEASAQYGPACAGEVFAGIKHSVPKRYIRLDLDRIYSGSNIAPRTYDNIAHEMFHAVQRGYPLFQKDTNDGCNLGGWIMEATAEAVGADTALNLKGVKLDQIKIGQRQYFEPLYVQHAKGATKNRAYWTASLWRYIGEYVSNGKKFPPMIQSKPPDYRYLQKFFAKKIDRYNEKTELDWLDENLKAHFKTSLANMYANFMPSFPHSLPDRIKPSANITRRESHKRLFETCESVTINEAIGSVSTKPLKFNGVSSRCIQVIYDGPENTIDVGIYMESDQKTVDSLQRIGVEYRTASGKKTIRALKAFNGTLTPDEHFSDWLFKSVPIHRRPTELEKSIYFVISNIANKASDTHSNPTVSFEVVYAKSTGNMTVTQTGP